MVNPFVPRECSILFPLNIFFAFQQFKNADFQYHKTIVDILNQVVAESKDGKILDIAAGSGVLGALVNNLY